MARKKTREDTPKTSETPENSQPSEEPTEGFSPDRMSRMTAPRELDDPNNRKRWGLPEKADERGPYLIELNIQHVSGLAGATHDFRERFLATFRPAGRGSEGGPPTPVKISKAYFRCELNVEEWKTLLIVDERSAQEESKKNEAGGDPFRYRSIYKIWPDFKIEARITRSIATIKADAALRSFEASGEGVTWAVIDSGVDGTHPHFGPEGGNALTDPRVIHLHRCFVDVGGEPLPDPDEETFDGPSITKDEREKRLEAHKENALKDPLGHGTHVAGIITGRVPDSAETVLLEKEEKIAPGDESENQPQRIMQTNERIIKDGRERGRFHGVAPDCRIVSLRVLDKDGVGRSSNIVRALEYIRERLNDNPKMLRVEGANLSVGYEFDAEMFACGQSPLCSEVNRLVLSGVVVVTAAGNTGYTALTANNRVTKVGLSNTINDPGNAEHAITVGATHRESPHTYGVSYFSSKGPTGDGRLKPDLVAPGERIISCAAGNKLDKALDARKTPTPADPKVRRAYYVEDSGTSMAAPHVSGAIAAFLSIRREFIGRPLEVKKIFLASAIPLGREKYFEGNGLVDLMKAIQSV
jgi:subtilisin family serine protease